MNIEYDRHSENEVEKSIKFDRLIDFYLDEYGQGELGNDGLPFLKKILIDVAKEKELQMGGSAIEVASGLVEPSEYWGVKSHLKKLQQELPNDLPLENRTEMFLGAINVLANGDPDFDIYVKTRRDLKDIFDLVYRKYGDGAEIKIDEFKVNEFDLKISENINLAVSWGAIYKGSFFNRICFQLKNNQDKKMFHIDITATPETGDDELRNRRMFVGDIHDNCRGKLQVEKDDLFLLIDKIPKADEVSNLQLEDKDSKSVIEITLREMRKKIMHFSSKNNISRNDFEMARIFPLMTLENIFQLRDLAFKNMGELDHLFQRQSPNQKQIIYQEMLLIAQKDPYMALIFLQDTGLDTLVFGRHLTRKETMSLLDSRYLDFCPNDKDKKISERVKKSREIYLNLDENDFRKNGLTRLIMAVGQCFGEQKDRNDMEIHFEKGLNILTNPKEKIGELAKIEWNNNLSQNDKEILNQLIIGGGLTEKGLHNLLNEKNDEKYPKERDDYKKFRKVFLKLKKEGLVEVAKRTIKVNNQEKEVWFYYPCLTSTRIEKILYEAGKTNLIADIYKSIGIETMEAALSVKKEELRSERFWQKIMSILHPYLLIKLIEYQKQTEKERKTYYYLDKKERIGE